MELVARPFSNVSYSTSIYSMESGTLVLWSLHLVAWDIIFSGKTQGPADIGLTPDTLVPWPLPLIASD